MKLIVGKDSDALHIRLDDSPVLESKEVEPGIVLDYNASNEVVGIGMLHLSKRSSPPELSVVEFQAASGSALMHSLDAANDEESYDETPMHGQPRRRIEQSEFAAITAKSEQLESTRTRKRSVFKTQRQRVVSGSCTLGIIALVLSLVVLAMSPLADIQVILLGVPVVIGVGVSIGLIRRARHTGRLTDEA